VAGEDKTGPESHGVESGGWEPFTERRYANVGTGVEDRPGRAQGADFSQPAYGLCGAATPPQAARVKTTAIR
jgi:hypothetical protein